MFLNPQQAIKEGWISGVDPGNVQPNAIDVTADRIFQMNEDNVFEISKRDKMHRNRSEYDNPNIWRMMPGVYDFLSNVYVDVPEGVVGWLVTRSSFNRNGMFVQSGLYDSGFKGNIGGMVYNLGGETRMEPGTPIAQFVFAKSDSAGIYAGGYNTMQGELPLQMKEDNE